MYVQVPSWQGSVCRVCTWIGVCLRFMQSNTSEQNHFTTVSCFQPYSQSLLLFNFPSCLLFRRETSDMWRRKTLSFPISKNLKMLRMFQFSKYALIDFQWKPRQRILNLSIIYSRLNWQLLLWVDLLIHSCLNLDWCLAFFLSNLLLNIFVSQMQTVSIPNWCGWTLLAS